MEVKSSDRRLVPGLPIVRPPEQPMLPSPTPLSPEPGADATLDVREVLRLLRRHLLLVIAAGLVFAGAAAYVAYRVAPSYEATATLRMGDAQNLAGGLGGGMAERAVGRNAHLSQLEVMRSRTLIGHVVDRAGLRLRPVDAAFPAGLLREVVVAADASADTIQ